jgi:thiamine kinase-like enzyme
VIADLERAIAAGGVSALAETGSGELACALEQALAGAGSPTLVAHERLKSRVFRLRFEVGDRSRSLVVKRMPPEHARRNELAIRRWLPDLGLGDIVPGLLGLAAERSGRWVWHVYEDLGPWELDPQVPDRERVAAVVREIARLHARSVAQPVLAECRLHGQDSGIAFLVSSVRNAIHGLEQLRPQRLALSDGQAEVRDRLLDRLHRLRAEEPVRTRAIEDWGGPETLLHGDLWTTNTFAQPTPAGTRVRIIDWDRAGVGPASYDLSTFLLRFAPERRLEIVELYREALAEHGSELPGRRELNLLFESAECARYASRAVWPAIALLRDGAAWGFEELAQVEGWFAALEPVLPEDPA